jgi:antirestriction protein ArdC
MTAAQNLIRRYNYFNGKPLSVGKLKAFHADVQRQLDHDSHGPYASELKLILERTSRVIKSGLTGEFRAEIKDPVPTKKPHLAKPKVVVQQVPDPGLIKKVAALESTVKSINARFTRLATASKKEDKASVKKPLPPVAIQHSNKSDLSGLMDGLQFIPSDQLKEYADPDTKGLGFTKEGQQKIYGMITGMILKVMKEHKQLPWRKPWTIESIPATNLKTKTVYKGANLFLLNLIAPMFFGKIGPYWLTYKQAQELGGQVKEGASGFPVIFYTVYYTVNKPKKKTITEEQYNSLTPQQRTEQEARELWTINYYRVFAQEDITGIDFPVHAKAREGTPIESAEKIVAGMPQRPEIIHHKSASAYYSPGDDHIKLPNINYFESDQQYYSTLFHELIHSTGHEKRLNRFVTNKEIAPKEKDYAFKELIAEMGASYLNAEAGTLYFTMKNAASYLKGWQKQLEDLMQSDNKFFLMASAKAAKAAEYILNRDTTVVEDPKPIRESKSPRPPVERKGRSKATADRSKKHNAVDGLPAKPATDPAGLPTSLEGVERSDQIQKGQHKEIPLNDRWKKEFHRVMSDTQIMIWGRPGSRKTGTLLLFAQYLAEQGKKTLYCAREEKGRSTFDEKLDMLKIGHPNLFISKYLPKSLEPFDAIVLDSVNALGFSLQDYVALVEANPGKMYIPIVQSNKDGTFKGGNEWEHEVDIAGEVVKGELILTKNRYDPDFVVKAEEQRVEHLVDEKVKHEKIKKVVQKKLAPEVTPTPEPQPQPIQA